jgi:hypothetical protein
LIKNLAALFLILFSIKGFSQNTDVRKLVVLTFEIEENMSSHPDTRYYWVAELNSLENLDDYEKELFYPIYLREGYSSNQLENCCLGNLSYPFNLYVDDKFEFPKDYSQNLENTRKLIKDNRQQIQIIKKRWSGKFKEKITVYATAVIGTLCECEYGGKTYVDAGNQISFPNGIFRPLDLDLKLARNNWKYKDFSNFQYSNTNNPYE